MDITIDHKIGLKQINVPPSKSFAQRALLAAALSTKKSKLEHIGDSADVQHILTIIKQLGAHVIETENTFLINGKATPIEQELNVGESGLGIRLTGSICACLPGDFTLIGKGSLLQRPMNDFAHFLPQIGVSCELDNGFLPLQIKGNAIPNEIEIDGSLSSQYLSGLLMGLPLLNGDSIINVNALKSKPYIDITLSVLADFGIKISHHDYTRFFIKGNQNYQLDKTYTVEGDYSGASIWMVYGAITSGVKIQGLNSESVQGDSMMLNALTASGVAYQWDNNNSLQVFGGIISPFRFDATECPDLFPALVVLAAAAKGRTILKGAGRLRHKESDRATVLKTEFKKLGLTIELADDEMHVHGTGELTTGTISSNNDHRIAMAGGIAAFLTKGSVTITKAESVTKSYPDFWKEFNSAF